MSGPLATATSRAADAVLEATVVLSFSRIGYLARRRLFGWHEPAAGSMAGRVVVVTGATGGLGAAIATAVARLGATVWLLGRDGDRTALLAQRIRADLPGADLHVAVADLTRLSDVRQVADTLVADTERLDVLVHNAGALMSRYELTVDGLEVTTQTHVVAPFLLTSLLLPRLRATPGAQVITVSSGGMYTRRLDVGALVPEPATFNGVAAYAQTKRAQVVLAQEWASRAGASGVSFQVTHPGWVDTPGLRGSLPGFGRLAGPMLRSPEQGADTVVWLASSHPAQPSGEFWHDRRPRSTIRLPRTATPDGEAGRLWEWTAACAGVPAIQAGRP
jgi:NAD(P)-dependent dehydrogenase (short-subunit alcohol dehydrogenase family)